MNVVNHTPSESDIDRFLQVFELTEMRPEALQAGIAGLRAAQEKPSKISNLHDVDVLHRELAAQDVDNRLTNLESYTLSLAVRLAALEDAPTATPVPLGDFLELQTDFPLRPIRDDQQYNEALDALYYDFDIDLSQDEQDYLTVLKLLIDTYEAKLPATG